MDQSFGDTGTAMAWAAGVATSSAFQEGLAFLGYPFLAELSTRPEFRRASETIATDMTRKWIRLQTVNETKASKIEQIEDALKKLKARDVFRKAAEHDGLFGRAHIYIDTADTDNPEELLTPIGDGTEPASKAKVNQKHPLRAIRAVEPVWCYPLRYNSSDPLAPDWYRPEQWYAMGKQIHRSRLLTIIGREVPDLLKPAYAFGGLPLSQMMLPYVNNWVRTRQSVSDIISAYSVMVLKTNLGDWLQPDAGDDEVFKRIELFNLLRNNRGVMVLDKNDEDFANVSASLSELSALQAQTQEHMGAVTGIPLVKLLGIQPAGLNASSEGEIRVYYDWIKAYQEVLFRVPLTIVICLIQLSLWGEVDDEITFEFESLWELSEKEAAEVRKVEAETDAILVNDVMAISQEEARTRIAHDADSPYSDIDPHELPEPPEIDIPGGQQEQEQEQEQEQGGGEGGEGGAAQERQQAGQEIQSRITSKAA